MKKYILTLATVSLAATASHGAQIFSDDFEAYAVSNPATDPLDSNLIDPNNVTWTPSSNALDAHRIFATGLYGSTQLWISLVDGSSLMSSGLDVQSGMTYTLDFFAAAETNTVNRGLNGSVDILVGSDFGSATSVIGGPQTYVVFGDSDASLNGGGNGTSQDKTDHMHQYSFDSGTVNPGDKMFMVFTRIEAHPAAIAGGAWFAIDDVTVDEATTVPEPSSAALVGVGVLGFILRRRR
ncbi:MAG: PEP-CTERM sorting domain-containing protein [Akkermansiaceae bacterium]